MRKAIITVAVLFGLHAPPTAEAGEVLTCTAEIRSLPEPEARNGRRFDLLAQIIQKKSGLIGCGFAVTDASGGIFLEAENRLGVSDYEAGDIVRWRGTTKIDKDGSINAVCRTTELVGRRPLPPVVDASPDRIPLGDYNYRRIRFRGLVTGIYLDEIDPKYEYIVMRARGHTVYASLQTSATNRLDHAALLDAEVEITGVCLPEQNGRRIFLGPRLNIERESDIRVMRVPPADPFSLPYIGNIHHVSAEDVSSTGRRRVDGRVIATWGGNRMIIRSDGGNAVRVETTAGPLPSCGTRIAVVGLPATDLFHLNVLQAVWKLLPDNGEKTEESPAEISVHELLFDEHGERKFKPRQQGKLFRLTGSIRSLPPPDDPSARMLISCDGNIIPIDASSCQSALDGLELDSIVTVTGVCVFDVQNWRPDLVFPRIEWLTIVLRQAQDITVISKPPWWTAGKLAVLIGGLLVILAAGLLWIRILKRIIVRRSRQLAKERLAHDRAETRFDERTRLAVELHDALSQTLTGVAFQIDAAESARRKDPAKVEHYLAVARKTLSSCRKELRNCLWDLQNHTLDSKDTEEAILETLGPHVERCDVAIDVDLPRTELSDQTFHAVLLIVRELVVNAMRHGEAKHIEVCGGLKNGIISFTVCDDGRGFDPAARPGLPEGHFGLHGIAERTERLGGGIVIDSAPGKGTRITITIENRT